MRGTEEERGDFVTIWVDGPNQRRKCFYFYDPHRGPDSVILAICRNSIRNVCELFIDNIF